MKDQSILNSFNKKGESYLDDLAFAVCVNGESLEKYKKIVEKKYGTDVYSNMVQFVNTLNQQAKRHHFTNTSLLSLKFLGKNAGLSEMAIDMIVNHLRDEWRDEQQMEERRKHDDTAFWKQCNPNNKYQLQEYLKKYPKGLFAARAVSLIADLERLEKKAIEESRVFNQCHTQQDYINYLSKYPNGTYSAKAKVIIEEFGRKEIEENRVYNLCKDKSDYLAYLRKYPNGKYVKEAQDKIKVLENTSNSMAKETAFWNQCSQNSINEYDKAAARERGTYLQEQNIYDECKTKDDFLRYISLYPNGMYASQARNKIAHLESNYSGLGGDNNKNTDSDSKVALEINNNKASLKELLVLLISAIVLYAVAYLIRDKCENLGPLLCLVSFFPYMLFAYAVVSNKILGMAICISGWFVMMFFWSDYAKQPPQSIILPALGILGLCSFFAVVAFLLLYQEKE